MLSRQQNSEQKQSQGKRGFEEDQTTTNQQLQQHKKIKKEKNQQSSTAEKEIHVVTTTEENVDITNRNIESFSASTVASSSKYKKWTRDDVAAVLCLDEEEGGAGLSVDKIQPLFDAGFDGTSLGNIVQDIKDENKHYAIEQLQNKFKQSTKENTIPVQLAEACASAVNWVHANLLSDLQSPQKRSDHLLKGIEEMRSGKKKELNFHTFYEKAQQVLESEQPKENVLIESDFSTFTTELQKLTIIRDVDVRFGYPTALAEKYQYNTSAGLPLKGNNILAKYQLPYFSQFHYKMGQEQTLSSNLCTSERNVSIFLGPSGAGKTSAFIRLLCNNPGIILTCTLNSEADSGLTTDSLMRCAHDYLSCLNLFELYGTVEQAILMVFICRLIYLIKLIEEAKQNASLFEKFGGILPFLAFMQSNGKTDSSNSAFLHALKYVKSRPSVLRIYLDRLVDEIIRLLNCNLDSFKINKKIKKFTVVIDEANVYASQNLSCNLLELVSLSGEKRGLLSNFAHITSTISKFHFMMFCGTNFSVDVGDVVQSALAKSEAKINISKIYDFGLVARGDLISFLEKHIKIPDKDKNTLLEDLSKKGYKYFRRRLITFALEILETDLITAFDKATSEILEDVTQRVKKKYFEAYESTENISRTEIRSQVKQDIIDALINYVIHYSFPFLGSNFKVNSNSVANALLYSGFSGPENEQFEGFPYFEFSAKDFIGYEIGKILLAEIWKENQDTLMKRIIQEKINMILNNSEQNIDMEKIVMLRLAELNGSALKDIGFFKNLIKKHKNMKNHQFKCIHYFTPKDYLDYCVERGIETNNMEAEQLYWTHFSQKKWDLLNGIFIMFSDMNHCDLFGINVIEGSNKVISIACQVKVRTGKENNLHQMMSATMHELFYLDNYAKLETEILYKLNKCTIEKEIIDRKEFLFVKKDNRILSNKHLMINSNAKWWSELRQPVLNIFQEDVYSFHLNVGLHPTISCSTTLTNNYKENFQCCFIDMNNCNLLFGKSKKSILQNYLKIKFVIGRTFI